MKKERIYTLFETLSFQDNTRTIHYGFATSSTYQQHTMNTSLTLAIVNDVFMVCLDYILKVKQG